MNRPFSKALWRAGLLFLAAALATLVVLVITDMAQGLRFTALHSRLGAFALIFIGCSYACLQVILRRPRGELLKGFLLGSAFALWGIEQLVPPGRWTTAMDTAVITIFVVDLGMIILGGLEKPAG